MYGPVSATEEAGGSKIPAGSIIAVDSVWSDHEGGIQFVDDKTDLGFFLKRPDIKTWLLKPRLPIDIFENEQSFREALAADRKEAIRQLMERKVDEWLEDSRAAAVGCLTQWALDELNLGKNDTLVGIAENQFGEE